MRQAFIDIAAQKNANGAFGSNFDQMPVGREQVYKHLEPSSGSPLAGVDALLAVSINSCQQNVNVEGVHGSCSDAREQGALVHRQSLR
jgi:hypothetical protein